MTIRSVLALVANLLFLGLYSGVLLLFSISLAAFCVNALGVQAFSVLGLILTAMGSGIYMGFEFFTLARGKGAPPIAVITLSVVLSPLLVIYGLGFLTREYSRLRDLILNLPRNLLSHLIPSRLT